MQRGRIMLGEVVTVDVIENSNIKFKTINTAINQSGISKVA